MILFYFSTQETCIYKAITNEQAKMTSMALKNWLYSSVVFHLKELNWLKQNVSISGL